MISSSSSFETINRLSLQKQEFLNYGFHSWITCISPAGVAAVTLNSLCKFLGNGIIIFLAEDKLSFNNASRSFPKNPSVLGVWVFDNFTSADELFEKANPLIAI